MAMKPGDLAREGYRLEIGADDNTNTILFEVGTIQSYNVYSKEAHLFMLIKHKPGHMNLHSKFIKVISLSLLRPTPKLMRQFEPYHNLYPTSIIFFAANQASSRLCLFT